MRQIVIWDGWIRLFHWTLGGLVAFLLISGKTGWMFFEAHRRAGELVLALLIFRLCWGLVGSSNARLTSLVSNPNRAFQHLVHLSQGTVSTERSHNPAGGWAVLLLLLLLFFQVLSGLLIADEEELIEGAFYGAFDYAFSDLLWEMHLINSNLLIALIVLHVVMVFVYLLRASQNLITPMLTGLMYWPSSKEPPPLFLQKWWVGLVLLTAIFGIVGWMFSWF